MSFEDGGDEFLIMTDVNGTQIKYDDYEKS